MRTLVVGLDAACRSVLDPLFEEGVTPTLRGLFNDWSGPLTSQIPPWTASAWPSLYTGRNPGKHGVFDFLSFEGDEWDVVNASDLRARTVWEYLDRAGYTSVIVNAPVTHPPQPIDGAVVPGYLAPDEPTCHPKGLLSDIQSAVGEYRVYAREETSERLPDEERAAEYSRLSRLRGETFEYLTDRFDPAFGFLQFQKTDAVFHDFPDEPELIREVYQAVDETIESVLAATDPDTVFVVSDHGIGPYDGRQVHVNEHLRRAGLVETGVGEEVPSWFRVKDEQLAGDGAGGSVVTRLAAAAGRVGVTYQRGKRLLERLRLDGIVSQYVSMGAVSAASESVSFRDSTVFLRSPSELGVRLNVADRDPGGQVPADNYDAVRDRVAERLREIETPNGEPVFESVVPRENHIEGPYADEAVDLFCIPQSFDHSLSVHVGRLFDDSDAYDHKQTGVIAATGTSVDTSAPVREPHIFDVAPTVLATFGLAPDAVMDGDPLAPVEASQPQSYPAFDPKDRVRTDDGGVERRLSDLGYLE